MGSRCNGPGAYRRNQDLHFAPCRAAAVAPRGLVDRFAGNADQPGRVDHLAEATSAADQSPCARWRSDTHDQLYPGGEREPVLISRRSQDHRIRS